ncbi:MAG: hypothetical protein SAJ72_21095, partial [Jaaginema sp. PMC 1080.18]|nr:hypothetical protein [Jaaginema sp. PMC 1080.18]
PIKGFGQSIPYSLFPTNNQQPTTNNQQPTTNNQQLITKLELNWRYREGREGYYGKPCIFSNCLGL